MGDSRTYAIIGAAMKVHSELGSGFTEYVYQDALSIEFDLDNIPFEKEKHLVVSYKGVPLKHDYFADFVCYDSVIVECKAVKSLAPEHEAQLLHYMKATNMSVGLLINFGEKSLVYRRYVL